MHRDYPLAEALVMCILISEFGRLTYDRVESINMNYFIQSRLGSLEKTSFSDLKKMPPCQTQDMYDENGKPLAIVTWLDVIDDDTIQVVVQSYRRFVLGVGKMNAAGFEKTVKGQLRRLEDREIYEFV